ncbi:hypothetical protein FSARC_14280 [Fusarium sarcochroum]|uniref:Uncharacterized protein n=1 Tax=Fusarium sarcochroum TaxID=1208366 RepID=A0A8H4WQH3_9HYPO|nr:hypothetical protein FSARC_14280 [Fusarium sarcochroum]
MLFTPLVLLFPAVSLASWLPIKPRQPSNADNCTFTSTLPPVTMTSVYPTSTVGSQSHMTGGGFLIYTTAFPTLGSDGPNLHTYTITAPCDKTQCQRPASGDCPPGFTATAVVCNACGEQAITTILTLPVESGPAAQASAGGDICKDGSSGSVEACQVPGGPSRSDTKNKGSADSRESDTYPAIHRHPGSFVSPASPTNTAPQMTTVDASPGRPTDARPGAESGSASSTRLSSPAPTSIVVTGYAPGSKINGLTLVKAVLAAVIALYVCVIV